MWLGRARRDAPRGCKHRYTWVVTYLDALPGTATTSYLKYRLCRRCGSHIERLA